MKQTRGSKIIIGALLSFFLLFGVVSCGHVAETTPDLTEKASSQEATVEPVATEPIATEPTSTEPIPTEPISTEPDPTTVPTTEPEVEDEESPMAFSAGNYITTEDIVVDMEKAVYHIGKNIYVPCNIENITNLTMNVLEQVSGLSFEENDYPSENFTDGKTHIFITRENMNAGAEWYSGLNSSEFGGAFEANGIVWASPGDFLLGNSYSIIHELGHALMWRQSQWHHGTTLNEGFAEYTTYLALLEMEENYPEAAVYFGESVSSINNMYMDYEELYKQPFEYWFDNYYEYAGNGNYAVGFRFMAYLHNVYGDYSSWTMKFGEAYPFEDRNQIDDASSLEQRITILKQTYGEDVLDNFYPWLKEHESDFELNLTKITDRSNLRELNIYPEYNAIQEKMVLENIKYNDLCINLEFARKYIEEYKGMDASKLVLIVSEPITVDLYHADGSCTQTITTGEPISLDGINSIQMVGEGTLKQLEISGFQQ